MEFERLWKIMEFWHEMAYRMYICKFFSLDTFKQTNPKVYHDTGVFILIIYLYKISTFALYIAIYD